jgi:hypothetical protein
MYKIKEKTKKGLKFVGKSLINLTIVSGVAFIFAFPDYIENVSKTRKWNPFKQKEFYENREMTRDTLQKNYESLFLNAYNFEDSVNVYLKNGLENRIELETPSWEEKERLYRESLK